MLYGQNVYLVLLVILVYLLILAYSLKRSPLYRECAWCGRGESFCHCYIHKIMGKIWACDKCAQDLLNKNFRRKFFTN